MDPLLKDQGEVAEEDRCEDAWYLLKTNAVKSTSLLPHCVAQTESPADDNRILPLLTPIDASQKQSPPAAEPVLSQQQSFNNQTIRVNKDQVALFRFEDEIASTNSLGNEDNDSAHSQDRRDGAASSWSTWSNDLPTPSPSYTASSSPYPPTNTILVLNWAERIVSEATAETLPPSQHSARGVYDALDEFDPTIPFPEESQKPQTLSPRLYGVTRTKMTVGEELDAQTAISPKLVLARAVRTPPFQPFHSSPALDSRRASGIANDSLNAITMLPPPFPGFAERRNSQRVPSISDGWDDGSRPFLPISPPFGPSLPPPSPSSSINYSSNLAATNSFTKLAQRHQSPNVGPIRRPPTIPVNSTPSAPYMEMNTSTALSPLLLTSTENIKNIWGAPEINVGTPLLPVTAQRNLSAPKPPSRSGSYPKLADLAAEAVYQVQPSASEQMQSKLSGSWTKQDSNPTQTQTPTAENSRRLVPSSLLESAGDFNSGRSAVAAANVETINHFDPKTGNDSRLPTQSRLSRGGWLSMEPSSTNPTHSSPLHGLAPSLTGVSRWNTDSPEFRPQNWRPPSLASQNGTGANSQSSHFIQKEALTQNYEAVMLMMDATSLVGQSPSLGPSNNQTKLPMSMHEQLTQTAGTYVSSSMPSPASTLVNSQSPPLIPATELAIVREIQTSKLRVDDSRLTKEYFERLTQEAFTLCVQICPSTQESMMQEQVLQVIQTVAEMIFPEAVAFHFGRTALGMSLASAEMDIGISLPESNRMSAAQCVEKLGHLLKQVGMKEVKMLTRARVPIVKMRDPTTNIRCDIGFHSPSAVHTTRLVKTYGMIDPRFRELTMLVKYWSKRRGINEPYYGTLSSYCYVLMVIHLLQHRGVLPCLQRIGREASPALRPTSSVSRDSNSDRSSATDVDSPTMYFFEDLEHLGDHWHCSNNESLGELLVAFFKYYSAEFPYVHGVASVRTGNVLSKEDKGWTKERQQELNRSGAVKDRYWLCVEDPFDVTMNVGRPIDKETLFEVRGEFIRASKILCGGPVSSDGTGNGAGFPNESPALPADVATILAKVCEKSAGPATLAGKKGANPSNAQNPSTSTNNNSNTSGNGNNVNLGHANMASFVMPGMQNSNLSDFFTTLSWEQALLANMQASGHPQYQQSQESQMAVGSGFAGNPNPSLSLSQQYSLAQAQFMGGL